MRAGMRAVFTPMASSLIRFSGSCCGSQAKIHLHGSFAASLRLFSDRIVSSRLLTSPQDSTGASHPRKRTTGSAVIASALPHLLCRNFMGHSALSIRVSSQTARGFHTSPPCRSLDEFFVSFPELDNQKNPIYPAVGRAWKTDELRQKSFDDLHKLWWILLKERNSLQIERHSARTKGAMIINPSRIRKVRLSMNRIKVVLGERKRMLGMLKRQAERAEAADGGEEGAAEFEYPASLLAHPYLAPQKPQRGVQRKRWRKFTAADPFHAKRR